MPSKCAYGGGQYRTPPQLGHPFTFLFTHSRPTAPSDCRGKEPHGMSMPQVVLSYWLLSSTVGSASPMVLCWLGKCAAGIK